jgi:hypothetical protein
MSNDLLEKMKKAKEAKELAEKKKELEKKTVVKPKKEEIKEKEVIKKKEPRKKPRIQKKIYCDECGKTYTSETTYRNHLKSHIKDDFASKDEIDETIRMFASALILSLESGSDIEEAAHKLLFKKSIRASRDKIRQVIGQKLGFVKLDKKKSKKT